MIVKKGQLAKTRFGTKIVIINMYDNRNQTPSVPVTYSSVDTQKDTLTGVVIEYYTEKDLICRCTLADFLIIIGEDGKKKN